MSFRWGLQHWTQYSGCGLITASHNNENYFICKWMEVSSYQAEDSVGRLGCLGILFGWFEVVRYNDTKIYLFSNCRVFYLN
jgi:hypothetical protein